MHVGIVLWAVILAGAGSAHGKSFGGIEILQGVWNHRPVEYLDKEILVGLKAGQTQDDLARELGTLPVEIVRNADKSGFLKLRVNSGDTLFRIIEKVTALPSVRYAEPNLVMYVHVIPNDPEFSRQWHYHNTGQNPPGGAVDADVDAPEGWDISTGSRPVKVGVLDSGIPYQNRVLTHPDLDDPARFLLGPDLVNGDMKPSDDNGHGTHVSGTIAAESNNGTGVAGICWNAVIVAIKVFNSVGAGTQEGFRDGCIYAVDNGCRVINYSGGGDAPSATTEHGVAYADSHGVVLCVSAGNKYQGSVRWPAAYSASYANVISVSATDHNDQSAPYSSIGPVVVVCAPGGYGSPSDENDVYSTLPDYLGASYGWKAGTSMAAPHVAGLAALMLSLNPYLTHHQVRQLIRETADDLGPAGFDNQFGWGRINVHNAMARAGQLTISHSPLPDTRDTINDYEVVCTVFSASPLVSDSLLLHYTIGASTYLQPLEPTGSPDEYRAFIPTQPPATNISYWMSARDSADRDTVTGVYSFRVIDFAFSLTPSRNTVTSAGGDTAWHLLWLTNTGNYPDSYSLTVTGATWTTAIYDSTSTTPLITTPQMMPDDSIKLLVRVDVPAVGFGAADSVSIEAHSESSPAGIRTAIVQTICVGTPLSQPLFESFPSSVIDSSKWLQFVHCSATDTVVGEPSPPYTLRLDGSPVGGDTLVSQPFDFSAPGQVVVSFFLQSYYAFTVDTLKVEFLNRNAEWVNFFKKGGGNPIYITDFQPIELFLPPEANHVGLQIRFTSEAWEMGGGSRYWHIDDISIQYRTDFRVRLDPWRQTAFGMPGNTAITQAVVHNRGLLTGSFALSDSAAAWDVSFWDESGTNQFTETPLIAPMDSTTVTIKVAVPGGLPRYSRDSLWIVATSVADSGQKSRAELIAFCAGPAATLPWYEPFPISIVDSQHWVVNRGVTISTNGDNPPTPPYSLRINGAFDTLESEYFDLSGMDGAEVSYYYQKCGGSDSPEPGDDLFVDYRNTSNQWLLLNRQLGSQPCMDTFALVKMLLPPDAYHRRFQLRFRAIGESVSEDNWFVDDISVSQAPPPSSPAIAVNPTILIDTLVRGFSKDRDLVISNAGAGTLHYSLILYSHPDFSKTSGQRLPAGFVALADSSFQFVAVEPKPLKGTVDTRRGSPANVKGRGVSWIDSDEPGGPDFNWIDVRSTGTLVNGLTDDNLVGPLPIDFDFPFLQSTYSEFYIGSNGLIGFGPTTGLSSLDNMVMPTTGAPDNILAWCWSDLDILNPSNPGGAVYYQSDGQRLVVQFVDYPKYGGSAGAVINAEVILWSDGKMLYQYHTVDQGFSTLDCTVGWEHSWTGVTVAFNADYIHDSLALFFFPLPPDWMDYEFPVGELAPGAAETLGVQLAAGSLDSGLYEATFYIASDDPDSTDSPWIVPVQMAVNWGALRCGDANLDNTINIVDLVFIVSYLFSGGEAPHRPASADVNNDEAINVVDITLLVDFLFLGGPPLVCE
ncbi:MAG TPA: S8 family serine peptidase [Candidatus Deferrimicrobium sp.]|nr:S8 family serine peptidase [Candidatus Deferrimicrobium sp.]